MLDLNAELLSEAIDTITAWREDDAILPVPPTDELRDLMWAIDLLVQNAKGGN